MEFLQTIDFPISPETAKTYLYVSLTLLIAVISDNLLRSFVKIPKSLESKRARTYVTIFRNIIAVVVYLIAFHIILILLNIDITPLLASAGIIGVVLGIGARPIIEDLITGLFLLSQNSIAIGDYVKIDDAEGTIEAIEFRTLTIRADNGSLFIIPNGQVKKVINFSRHKASVFVDLPVKADQKIDVVLKAANDALSLLQKDEEMGTSLFPGSAVNGIEDFKATGPMVVRTTIITYPARRWEVGRKFRSLVKKEFEKHKILFG